MHVMRGGKEFLNRVDVIVCEVDMFHPASDFALPDFGDTVLLLANLASASMMLSVIKPVRLTMR